jgi:DNA polymerase II small subunit/DNA polymerase delta subunit B
MDEKTIKELLRRGYMVTPDTLKRIEEVGVEAFFSENAGSGTFLMGTKKQEPQKPTLEISVSRPITKPSLDTKDLIRNYTNRYNTLKSMLSGKTEAISINKAASQFEASVIGMVKQVNPQGFSLEDPTGSIGVVSRQRVDLDDVIGVRGTVREGVMQAKEIIYPDIPLSRQTPKIEAKLPLSIKTENNNSVLLIGDNKTEPLKNLIWINLEKGGNKIHILAYKPQKETGPDTATGFLKKRHLYPGIKDIVSSEDSHVIDPIPDFFWIIGKSRWKNIYKGVTVFSTPENSKVDIDLSTRELTFS